MVVEEPPSESTSVKTARRKMPSRIPLPSSPSRIPLPSASRVTPRKPRTLQTTPHHDGKEMSCSDEKKEAEDRQEMTPRLGATPRNDPCLKTTILSCQTQHEEEQECQQAEPEPSPAPTPRLGATPRADRPQLELPSSPHLLLSPKNLSSPPRPQSPLLSPKKQSMASSPLYAKATKIPTPTKRQTVGSRSGAWSFASPRSAASPKGFMASPRSTPPKTITTTTMQQQSSNKGNSFRSQRTSGAAAETKCSAHGGMVSPGRKNEFTTINSPSSNAPMMPSPPRPTNGNSARSQRTTGTASSTASAQSASRQTHPQPKQPARATKTNRSSIPPSPPMSPPRLQKQQQKQPTRKNLFGETKSQGTPNSSVKSPSNRKRGGSSGAKSPLPPSSAHRTPPRHRNSKAAESSPVRTPPRQRQWQSPPKPPPRIQTTELASPKNNRKGVPQQQQQQQQQQSAPPQHHHNKRNPSPTCINKRSFGSNSLIPQPVTRSHSFTGSSLSSVPQEEEPGGGFEHHTESDSVISNFTGCTSGEERIQVAVRMRPLLRVRERQHSRVWNVAPHKRTVTQIKTNPKEGSHHSRDASSVSGHSLFRFDHAFDETSTTQQVYNSVAKGIVEAVLQGLNGTVFCYGQTASGKTYTMQGAAAHMVAEARKERQGLVQMAASDIFEHIQQQADETDFSVSVSVLEIYKEQVRDLLAPVDAVPKNLAKTNNPQPHPQDQGKCLPIRQDGERGVFVPCTEKVVETAESLNEILFRGERARVVAATAMNERSSRSHTIYRIAITSRPKEGEKPSSASAPGAVLASTLNLVDLAGSESVKTTGATGERQKEGAKINQSLLTLSRVLSALGSADARKHACFRDSKLTRLLQTHLSGNARIAIICCATPSAVHLEETRSTLAFATRAKLVPTHATINHSHEPIDGCWSNEEDGADHEDDDINSTHGSTQDNETGDQQNDELNVQELEAKYAILGALQQAQREPEDALLEQTSVRSQQQDDHQMDLLERKRNAAQAAEGKFRRLQQSFLRQTSVGPGADEDAQTEKTESTTSVRKRRYSDGDKIEESTTTTSRDSNSPTKTLLRTALESKASTVQMLEERLDKSSKTLLEKESELQGLQAEISSFGKATGETLKAKDEEIKKLEQTLEESVETHQSEMKVSRHKFVLLQSVSARALRTKDDEIGRLEEQHSEHRRTLRSLEQEWKDGASAHEDEKKALKASIEDTRAAVRLELQEEIRLLQSKIESLEQEKEAIAKELELARTELKAEQSANQSAVASEKELTEQLNVVKTKNTLLVGEHESLLHELQDAHAQLHAAETKTAESAKQVQALQEERDRLAKELDTASIEKQSETEQGTREIGCESCQQEVERTKDLQAEKEKEAEQKNMLIAELEALKAAKDSDIEKAVSEQAALVKEIETLKVDKQRDTEERSRLIEELNSLKAEMQKSREEASIEHARLVKDLEKLQVERDQENEQRTKLVDELETLKADKQDKTPTQQELDELLAENPLELRGQDDVDELAILRKELESARAEKQEAIQEAEHHAAECAKLAKELESTKAEVQECVEKAKRAEARHVDMATEFAVARAEKQDAVERATREAELLNKELQSVRAEKQELLEQADRNAADQARAIAELELKQGENRHSESAAPENKPLVDASPDHVNDAIQKPGETDPHQADHMDLAKEHAAASAEKPGKAEVLGAVMKETEAEPSELDLVEELDRVRTENARATEKAERVAAEQALLSEELDAVKAEKQEDLEAARRTAAGHAILLKQLSMVRSEHQNALDKAERAATEHASVVKELETLRTEESRAKTEQENLEVSDRGREESKPNPSPKKHDSNDEKAAETHQHEKNNDQKNHIRPQLTASNDATTLLLELAASLSGDNDDDDAKQGTRERLGIQPRETIGETTAEMVAEVHGKQTSGTNQEEELRHLQSTCKSLRSSLGECEKERNLLSAKCKDLVDEMASIKNGVARALEEMDDICAERDALSHEMERSSLVDREILQQQIEELDDQLQKAIADVELLATGEGVSSSGDELPLQKPDSAMSAAELSSVDKVEEFRSVDSPVKWQKQDSLHDARNNLAAELANVRAQLEQAESKSAELEIECQALRKPSSQELQSMPPSSDSGTEERISSLENDVKHLRSRLATANEAGDASKLEKAKMNTDYQTLQQEFTAISAQLKETQQELDKARSFHRKLEQESERLRSKERSRKAEAEAAAAEKRRFALLLKTAAEKAHAEIESLRGELNAANQSSHATHSEKSRIDDILEAKSTELDETREALNLAEDEIKVLRRDRGRQDRKLETTQTELDRTTERMNQLSVSVETAEAELERTKASCTNLRDSLTEHEQKVDQLSQECAALRQKVADYEAELAEAQDAKEKFSVERDEMTKVLEELTTAAQDLHNDMEHLVKEKAKFRTIVEAKEAEIEELTSEMDTKSASWEEEKQAFVEERDSIVEHLDTVVEEISKINKEKAKLSKERDSLLSAVQLMEENNETLVAEREKLSSQVETFNSEKQHFEEELQQASSHLPKFEKELEDLREEKRQLVNDRDSLREDLDCAQAGIKNLSDEIVEHERKIKELQSDLDKSEEFRSELEESAEADKQSNERDIRMLTTQKNSLEEQCEALELEVESLNDTLTSLDRELADAKTERRALAKANEYMTSQLDSLTREKSQFQQHSETRVASPQPRSALERRSFSPRLQYNRKNRTSGSSTRRRASFAAGVESPKSSPDNIPDINQVPTDAGVRGEHRVNHAQLVSGHDGSAIGSSPLANKVQTCKSPDYRSSQREKRSFLAAAPEAEVAEDTPEITSLVRARRSLLSWDDGLCALRMYMQAYPFAVVPDWFRDLKGHDLGNWVEDCRQDLKDGNLDAEQVATLEKLCPFWKLTVDGEQQAQQRNLPWDTWLEALDSFRNGYGTSAVPKWYKDPYGRNLGYWVNKQRVKRNNGTLAHNQIKDLDARNFVWSAPR